MSRKIRRRLHLYDCHREHRDRISIQRHFQRVVALIECYWHTQASYVFLEIAGPDHQHIIQKDLTTGDAFGCLSLKVAVVVWIAVDYLQAEPAG